MAHRVAKAGVSFSAMPEIWTAVVPEFAPAEVYDSPLRRELQAAGFRVQNGAISFPERPGIGYDLPAEIVERFHIA